METITKNDYRIEVEGQRVNFNGRENLLVCIFYQRQGDAYIYEKTIYAETVEAAEEKYCWPEEN